MKLRLLISSLCKGKLSWIIWGAQYNHKGPPAHSAAVSPLGCPGGLGSKESACNAGDPGSIPGLGKSPGEGNGNPLQYSCLENPMDRRAWQATAHGVAKSQAQMRDWNPGSEGGKQKIESREGDDASSGQRDVAGERLDWSLLALKVEGTTGQGMQAAFGIQKKQGNRVSLGAFRRDSALPTS